MRRLWGGGPVDFAGRFTTVPGLTLDPGPVQAGGPPIWLGGRRPAAIRRAGRFADVWMPYMYSPEQLASSLAEARATAGGGGPGSGRHPWRRLLLGAASTPMPRSPAARWSTA